MRRQNSFQQIISIAIILLFLPACNAQADGFTPTLAFTATAKVLPTATATMMPTATATAQPTATEVSRFTVDKMTKIPKSIKEMADNNMCVEIASPIDNPAKYKKDMLEYTGVIRNDIFPTYTGPVIKLNDLSIGGDKFYFLGGAKVSPIACAEFKYKGDAVVLITLTGKDNNGLYPLNIILNPRNVDHVEGYRTTPDDILGLMPGEIEGGANKFQFATAQVTGNTEKFYSNQFMRDYYAVTANSRMKENMDALHYPGVFPEGDGDSGAALVISWWNVK